MSPMDTPQLFDFVDVWRGNVGRSRFVPTNYRKCGKPITQTSVELHPSRRDLALHNFQCADCGPVKTKIISLKPDEPSPEPTA